MSSTSQILISGATGFIGRYLVRALLEGGAEVRVLVRNEEKARHLFGEKVRTFRGDLHNSSSIQAAMQGVATVYHAAGLYLFGRSHSEALMEVNVQGTRRILQAAHEAGVPKVVHISSAGILARPEGGADENSFPATQPQGRPYKASKWLAEHEALRWAEKGLPVVIANPTCPLGPEDETPTGQIIRDFLQGHFTFSCRTGLNFSDCRDLARGLIACAEHGRSGERYILGHHNLMLTDFLNMLAAETGLPGPRGEVPWPLIAAGAIGSECLLRLGLLKENSRLCWETAQQSRFIQFFDSSKARTELKWQPRTPLQETLRWTLESYGWKQTASGRVLAK